MRKLILFAAMALPAMAEHKTVFYSPRNVRPERIEEILTKTMPSVGVAVYAPQNTVIISGDEDTMQSVLRMIHRLDQPGPVVVLEIGTSGLNDTREGVTGLGATVTRDNNGRQIPPAPSEFRRSRGYSRDNASQMLTCMPGHPAEVFVGETQFRDAGLLNPPIQVQAGKRVVVENLRVIGDGTGAEFDISIENTVPGSGPVVSSGTRMRTAVRLNLGETVTVAGNDGDNENGGTTFDNDYDKSGGSSRLRRTTRRGVSTGNISVTLKNIR